MKSIKITFFCLFLLATPFSLSMEKSHFLEEKENDCHFPQFTLLPIKLWKHILFFATQDLLYVLQVHPEDYKDILKTRLLFRVLCKVINSFSLKDLFPTIEGACEKLILSHQDDVLELIAKFSQKKILNQNQEQLIKLFFKKGLSFYEHCYKDKSPFDIVLCSSRNKNHKLTKQLINNNALIIIYNVQLIWAILLHDEKLIASLIAQCDRQHDKEHHKCPFMITYRLLPAAHYDGSAQNIAAANGNIKILQFILEHTKKYSKPDTSNDRIGSALITACKYGLLDIAQFLIPFLSNINFRDAHKRTPLKTACAFGHLEIVKELLKHPQIDIMIKDFKGHTAAMIALENNHKKIAAKLLRYQEKKDREKGIKKLL